MAGGIDWFRWHHGAVSDQKFQLIARRSGSSVAECIAVWACLLESASLSADRGNPGEPDFEAMDCALGIVDGRSEAIYRHMSERGLIADDGRLTAWDRRQPRREREDDTAAERKRQQREREAAQTDEHVTPSHTKSHQVTPREEKRREEEIRGEKSKTKTDASRGSRLTSDWVPPDEFIEFCRSERKDLDPIFMQEKFRDYWSAKPGKDGRKTDWLATWRNFIRSERATPQPRAGPQPYESERDKSRKAAARSIGLGASNDKQLFTIDENGDRID